MIKWYFIVSSLPRGADGVIFVYKEIIVYKENFVNREFKTNSLLTGEKKCGIIVNKEKNATQNKVGTMDILERVEVIMPIEGEEMEGFLSTEEVAQRLDVSPRTVLNYISLNYFPNARKKNPFAERRSEWLIPIFDVENFEQKRDDVSKKSGGHKENK